MNGNNEGTGVYNTPSRSLQHVWRSDASSVSVLSTCRPSRLTPAMIVTDLEAQMLEVNCLLLRNVYLIHVMEIRFETIIILMIFGHCSVRKIFVWVMLTGGLEKKSVVTTIIVTVALLAFISAPTLAAAAADVGQDAVWLDGPARRGRRFTFFPGCHRTWDLVSGAPRTVQDGTAPRNLCSHSLRVSRSNRGASAKS